ncbi:MAG: group-specific protein [Chlamydiia bacterium]|nr:group-specific protein [Chlamydiia bacterium]
MKFYIATSLSRVKDHNLVRDALMAHEHKLTYDWTLHGSVKSVSKRRLQEVSLKELSGIASADWVIVLLPGGKGTHVELGFAIGRGKNVILHSEDDALFELGPETNAFFHYPKLTRLTCPLVDVAALMDSSLLQLTEM